MANQAEEPTVAAKAHLRPAQVRDIPHLSALLQAEHLPSTRIEEVLDGFIVAERAGEVIGGGGLEVYGSSGLLRSVVVAPSGRGTGLGREMALRLERMASERGVKELYLFTVGAWRFWEHLGYKEIPIEDWSAEARASWQHVYVSAHQEMFREMGTHSMWKWL